MNKFALTTIASLPGSGAGCASSLPAEVGKEPDEVEWYEGELDEQDFAPDFEPADTYDYYHSFDSWF